MVASIGHYIDNKPVAGKSGRTGEIPNPATGEVPAKVAFATQAEVDAAVQVAKKAQLAWAATQPLRRQRIMFNLKGLIEKRTDDLARHLSLEHGKTFDDAKGEVGRGLEVVEFACGIAHHMKGDFTEQVASDMDTWSIRQPLGVVAGITPFNFPIMIPCWMGAMAVATGNAFILKPSEKDPSAPMLLAALYAQAGAARAVAQDRAGPRSAVRDGTSRYASAQRQGDGIRRSRREGRRQAGGRRPGTQIAGLRERQLHGRLPVRRRQAGDEDLQGRDLRAGALGGALQELRRGDRAGERPRPPQRHRDLHPRRRRRAHL